MISWRDLTDKEREDLLLRKLNGEHPLDIAEEIGMNGITLTRRLQELEKKKKGIPDGVDSDPDGVNFSETKSDNNHKELTVTGDRILTVEQLLSYCDVDLDEWEVEKSVVNKWEGYRKHDKKNLRWEGGSIQEGFVEDDGSLKIEPLFQIKVWLVRKNPIPINPVIKPVRFNFSASGRGRSQHRSQVRTAMILPDAHFGFRRDLYRGHLFPFHDRRALSVALEIAKSNDFDDLVVLGDFLDLPDWSTKFIRTPEFEQVTQPALVEAGWWLNQFRFYLPDTEMYYIEGNHEKRLRDMIATSLPQAYMIQPVNKMISYSAWEIPNLLGLKDRGIEWVGDYPNGIVWLSENLVVVHGDGLSADKVVNTTDVTTIFGHIHRLEMAVRPVFHKDGGRIVTAYCPGFLGRLDGSVPGQKNRQKWSQGIGIVTYTNDGYVNIEHVEINNGVGMFRGDVYEAEDSVVLDLNKDTENVFNF
jgi:metallophosphoesterase superfamily enzyme